MKLKLLNKEEYDRRFNELFHLKELGIDNAMKVTYASEILEEAGQKYNVTPPKKKTLLMKQGNCYSNAIRKTKQGFQYVEGVITRLESGLKISHAWNVDSEGNHIDFTNKHTNEYEYLGLIIPSDLLFKVGALNGYVWYSALPYLTVA